MSLMNSTGDRLRRATQLWHAYLAATGQRFELAQFLKDPALEKQVLDSALASGDPKLIALAQDWLRDTGQAVPAVVASRVLRRQRRPHPHPRQRPPNRRSLRATCAACANNSRRRSARAFPEAAPRLLTSQCFSQGLETSQKITSTPR